VLDWSSQMSQVHLLPGTEQIVNVALANLKQVEDVPLVGHALLSTIHIDIGQTNIDDQYQQWLQIWEELDAQECAERNNRLN